MRWKNHQILQLLFVDHIQNRAEVNNSKLLASSKKKKKILLFFYPLLSNKGSILLLSVSIAVLQFPIIFLQFSKDLQGCVKVLFLLLDLGLLVVAIGV